MNLASRLLALAMVFLLLCAFTTSLLKTEPPSFEKALDMFSDVSVDVGDLFSRFVFEPPSNDTFVIPEDAGAIETAIWNFINSFIGVIYELIAAVTVVYSVIMLLVEVGDAALTICKVIIYLMFGIDVSSLNWDFTVETAPATA